MTRDIERDRFMKSKLPDNLTYDYIVIGSGISGLYSAALLARSGYSVLVLESHDRAGGCMHYFHEHGYEFDTGIHYIGNPKYYENKMKHVIHPDMKYQFDQMGDEADNYTYDFVFIGENEPFPLRKQGLKTELLKRFPHEKEGIEKFMNHVHGSSLQSRLWGLGMLVPTWMSPIIMKAHKWLFPDLHLTYQQMLDKYFQDQNIKNILGGNFGNVGRYPSESNAAYVVWMMSHFDSNGGSYPHGGCQTLIKPLIPVIEKVGGRVLVNATVQEIIVSPQNKAMGVVLENKQPIRAKKGVISSVGYIQTCKLCPSLPRLPHSLCRYGQTHHVYVFIGIKGSQDELKLPSANYWCLEGMKSGESHEEYLRSLHSNFFQTGRCIGFIGFPSAKDRSYNDRFPGKSTCMLLTEVKCDMFKDWSDTQIKKRPQDYEELKNKIAKHLMETVLFKHFPQLREKIDHMSVGTPLTTAHYLKKYKGSSYGIDHNCARFSNGHRYLRPETPVQNLWLTGQDLIQVGWAASIQSAEITATLAAGYGKMSLLTGNDIATKVAELKPLQSSDF